MRNFIFLGLVGVCTVLIAGNSASAVVGGGNDKKKHNFHIKNMHPHKQVHIWMRPKGTKKPKGHREWKAKGWMKIDPKKHGHAVCKPGWHECTCTDGGKKFVSKTWLIDMKKDKHFCSDGKRIWEEGKKPPRPPRKSSKKSKKSRKGKGKKRSS